MRKEERDVRQERRAGEGGRSWEDLRVGGAKDVELVFGRQGSCGRVRINGQAVLHTLSNDEGIALACLAGNLTRSDCDSPTQLNCERQHHHPCSAKRQHYGGHGALFSSALMMMMMMMMLKMEMNKHPIARIHCRTLVGPCAGGLDDSKTSAPSSTEHTLHNCS